MKSPVRETKGKMKDNTTNEETKIGVEFAIQRRGMGNYLILNCELRSSASHPCPYVESTPDPDRE